MPHPRKPEAGHLDNNDDDHRDFGQSLSVAEAHPYLDEEIQVLQPDAVSSIFPDDLTYKDQGRPYNEVLRQSAASEVQSLPPDPSTQSAGATSTSFKTERSQTTNTSTKRSTSSSSSMTNSATQHSSSSRFKSNTYGSRLDEETPGLSENQGEGTILPLAEEQEKVTPWFKKKKMILMVALGLLVFVIGGVVGVVVAASAGGDSDDEDDISENKVGDHSINVVQSAMHGDVDRQFGFSLSLNKEGTRLAVADLNSVQIFEQSSPGSDWSEVGSRIESPGNTTETMGLLEVNILIRAPVIVEMSGNGKSVAVGWCSYAGNRGIVKVYRYDDDIKDWEVHGEPMVGELPGDFFGASLDISEIGSTVAVGAPGRGGMVSVSIFNAGEWVRYGSSLSREQIGDLTITSIALASDGRALAFGGVAGTAEIVARMYAFDLGTGDWMELGTGLGSKNVGVGYNVDLSGDGTTVAISNYYYLESNLGENNDALDVRAYTWSDTAREWVQLGETQHAFSPGAKSGYFISLSEDGRTMVMGDPGRRGEAGLGGNRGHAHVYFFDEDSWEQIGPNIEGDAPGDHFGYDVTVSGDGKRFASSGPYSRALGTQDAHGRVLVYEISHGDE